MVELYDYQKEALKKLKTGSVLCGGVGSGKSIVAVSYYISICVPDRLDRPRTLLFPRDLYIITTAKKRDSGEWENECNKFLIGFNQELNLSKVKLTIDSWNNIKKYTDVFGAFFIFDEQRVVGSGAWVKAFLNITRKNKWILLSATPGDRWEDYIPVFVANGFYKNKTDFTKQHLIFSRFAKYPKIEGYYNERKLKMLQERILVPMDDRRETKRIQHDIICSYDKNLYKTIWRDRWNPYENCPIEETGKLFYLLRMAVNSDESRIRECIKLLNQLPRAIIFYNFDYELEILRKICKDYGFAYSEWNGHNHEEILKSNNWCYLVQYSAGSEGWNCIETNSIIFYSQNYSYRQVEQASGRIDRINTEFRELHYYHLRSSAPIDIAIHSALIKKQNFNERKFMERKL